MKKLYNWLNEQSQNNNAGLLVDFLKFMYSLGNIQLLHSIAITMLGIFIPVFIDKGKTKIWILLCIILVVDIFWNYICSTYRLRKFEERKFAAEVLQEQSSLINSIGIEMRENSKWKTTIFRKTSELVCEKIRNDFKEVLNCNTRVSVEYTFNKKDEDECYVKMAARRSDARQSVGKAVLLSKKEKYFSYQIFTENSRGINILNEKQIEEDNWYKNPEHKNDVKIYIGIAISLPDNKESDVAFILQIDCLDNVKFGDDNTDDDIKKFINNYLMTYIHTISLAYLLNLSKDGKIPEVF